MSELRLLAFDPGKLSAGWSAFEEKRLARCGLLRAPTQRGLFEAIREWDLRTRTNGVDVWIERPQVYREAHWKGDPNDLIDVAIVVGALASQATGNVVLVRPHDWKGNVPKTIHNARIKRALDPAERDTLKACGAPAGLLHNVVDAVGLGLHALGRLR